MGVASSVGAIQENAGVVLILGASAQTGRGDPEYDLGVCHQGPRPHTKDTGFMTAD